MKRILLIMLAALLPAAVAQELAFTNARVFDGRELLPAGTVVLVSDGVITEVGTEVEVPEDATVVDAAGQTLLPGLIESHQHTFYEAALVQNLAFGVTTTIDMFTDESLAGFLRGPASHRSELIASGMLATAPHGHGTQFGVPVEGLTDPAGAEAFVQARIDAGADFIKIILEDGHEMDMEIPNISDEVLRAVIQATHEQGLLAVVHVQTLEAAKQAVDAGADGLAHIFSDAVADQEFIEAAVEAGIFVIPTLSVFQSIGGEPADMTLAEDPFIGPLLTQQDRQSLANPLTGFPQLSAETARESVRLLNEAGVPLLAGTDAQNPGTAYGASMHRELEVLVQAGLTPQEALTAATAAPAEAFGLDGRGRIAPGMAADLLLVESDPLEDILKTREISGIWKSGVHFSRGEYSEGVSAAEAAMRGEGAPAVTEPVIISDFSDASVAFGQPWEATTDVPAGGDSTAEMTVEDGVLHVTGTVGEAFLFPWSGVMFMPGDVPFTPANLSAVPTVHFTARAEPAGAYRLQVYCGNLGQMIGEATYALTEEFQEVEVSLPDAGGCDPVAVNALIFTSGNPGAYSMWFDEVGLR